MQRRLDRTWRSNVVSWRSQVLGSSRSAVAYRRLETEGRAGSATDSFGRFRDLARKSRLRVQRTRRRRPSASAISRVVLFEEVAGVEVFGEFGEERFVFGRIVAGEQDCGSAETVDQTVAGGDGIAERGDGAGGVSGVVLIGLELSGG